MTDTASARLGHWLGSEISQVLDNEELAITDAILALVEAAEYAGENCDCDGREHSEHCDTRDTRDALAALRDALPEVT